MRPGSVFLAMLGLGGPNVSESVRTTYLTAMNQPGLPAISQVKMIVQVDEWYQVAKV